MSNVWIQNSPASRRTLILCLLLGLSVAAHRAVVGFQPFTAEAGEQVASLTDSLSVPRSMPAPPTPGPLAPTSAEPAAPSAEPRPAQPREPRMNPYARRMWVMDPFRAPNVLRLAGEEIPLPANAGPPLNEEQTREVLARTTIEHSTTPEGATHVSITMPGPTSGQIALATGPQPGQGAPRANAQAGRPQARTVSPPGPFEQPLAPCIFAFAGYDLTREEGRRWTLALAFEGRDY